MLLFNRAERNLILLGMSVSYLAGMNWVVSNPGLIVCEPQRHSSAAHPRMLISDLIDRCIDNELSSVLYPRVYHYLVSEAVRPGLNLTLSDPEDKVSDN